MIIKNLNIILISLCLLFFSSQNVEAIELSTPLYNNNLVEVFGDVKQGFIQYKLTTTTQIDNLLKGFKTMKVTGIRVPIFANDSFQNKKMLDYFIAQAKLQGFKIFANPTNGGGGYKIAQGIIPGDGQEPGPVINNPVMTQNLINRIREFAETYKVDYINPFNEDGRVNTVWSKSQINTIYSSLFNNVGGATLIGPCTWGIEAGIDMLKNSDVLKYVSIATTHNLGFQHSLWPQFIAEAKGMPVWDSEATNNVVDDKRERLKVAVESGVNGVVLYNCWSEINLTNGSLNANAKALMDVYLNPNTSVLNTNNCQVSQGC